MTKSKEERALIKHRKRLDKTIEKIELSKKVFDEYTSLGAQIKQATEEKVIRKLNKKRAHHLSKLQVEKRKLIATFMLLTKFYEITTDDNKELTPESLHRMDMMELQRFVIQILEDMKQI